MAVPHDCSYYMHTTRVQIIANEKVDNVAYIIIT